jgi:hypothetical protein
MVREAAVATTVTVVGADAPHPTRAAATTTPNALDRQYCRLRTGSACHALAVTDRGSSASATTSMVRVPFDAVESIVEALLAG